MVGTADDRPWTVYERTIPAATDNYITDRNTGEHYNTFDVSAHKRFAKGDEVVIGWDRTIRILGDSTSPDPNTLQFNGPNRARVSQWDFKLFGTYSLPWRISLSGSVSVQKGEARSRTVNFTPALLVNHPAALAQGSTTVTVDPSGAYYLPNITQTTLHLEKKFKGPVKGDAITGVIELYNIQNANTIIGENNATGVTTNSLGQTVPTFSRYTQTLNPRIVRFGVRYSF